MDYLSINQVCEKLSCHPNTVRNLIRRGVLRAHRVGARIRVPVESLNAYLHSTKIQVKVQNRIEKKEEAEVINNKPPEDNLPKFNLLA